MFKGGLPKNFILQMNSSKLIHPVSGTKPEFDKLAKCCSLWRQLFLGYSGFLLVDSIILSGAAPGLPVCPGIYPAYVPVQSLVFAAGGDSASPYATLRPSGR